MKLSFYSTLLTACAAVAPCPAAIVIDFEELTQFTGISGNTDNQPGGQFYNGNSGNGNNSDGWSSQGVSFENTYEFFPAFNFESWTGWSYSNVRNDVTPGFTNQFAAFPEGGTGPSNTYAIGYIDSQNASDPAVITLPTSTTIESIDIANTTYALRWLRDGLDGFAPEPRAGDAFEDGDFFQLTITGFDGADATGNQTGSVSVDLADYTNGQSNRLEGWLTQDLAALGPTRSLAFSLAASQVGPFGIETPLYFAADNLRLVAVPEPSTLGLVLCGTAVCLRRRRATS